MASQATYAMGSTDLEHQRLMVQARLLRPWTDHFLRTGGLRPGMSVLDLGSGIGDVSLLAAEIVGPQGRVLGIDRDEVITEKARRRVEGEALTQNVAFEVADLEGFDATQRFDAVIGRYILLYQDDPAAILRRYARFLRPGGVLIFHDIDMTNADSSSPPCPIWDDAYGLLATAFRAVGAAPDFGRRLSGAFVAAGLSRPTVEAVIPIATGPESPIFDWIARSLRSIEPLLTRAGERLPAGLDVDDLVEQWQNAVVRGVQIHGPVQYGAWTRVPWDGWSAPW